MKAGKVVRIAVQIMKMESMFSGHVLILDTLLQEKQGINQMESNLGATDVGSAEAYFLENLSCVLQRRWKKSETINIQMIP
jgi:hypothetical protein